MFMDVLNLTRNRFREQPSKDYEYTWERKQSTAQKVRNCTANYSVVSWDTFTFALIILRDISSDRVMLEKKVMGKLRNMIFKSFNHEIKTPLNSIQGRLEMISLALTDRAASRHGLIQEVEATKAGCVILMNNVADLIDYHRIEADDLTVQSREFSLKELYNTVAGIFRSNHNSTRTRFKLQVDRSLPATMVSDQPRI